ncbi:MAG: hypothetical protein ACOYOB_19865 [Myxococcota bacterium]
MSRTALHAVLLAALLAASPACESNPQPEPDPTLPSAYDCVNPGSTVDCTAVAEVRVESTGALVANGDEFAIDVSSIPIGASTDLRFVITNTTSVPAAAELRIAFIFLEYVVTGPDESTGPKTFECFEGDSLGAGNPVKCGQMQGKWQKIVPVALADASKGRVASQTFVVRYTRIDGGDSTAKVRVHFDGDRDLAQQTNGEFTIRFKTAQGTPKALVSPSDVLWPFIQPTTPEEQKWQTFKLTNVGDGYLIVSAIQFEGSSDFSLEVPGPSDTTVVVHPGDDIAFDPLAEDPKFLAPFQIAPGASHTFAVRFSPTDDLAKQGFLQLLVNDPSAPGLNWPPYSHHVAVTLTANYKVPCIKVEPIPKVTFGGVPLGISDTKDFVVKSCGGEDLAIYGIALTGTDTADEFSLDFTKTIMEFPSLDATGPTAAKPLVLTQQGDAIVSVRYTPKDVTPLDGNGNPAPPDTVTIEVTSNAFATKKLVVEGHGLAPKP